MTKATLNQQGIVLVLVLEKLEGKCQITWGHFKAVASRLNLSVIQGDAELYKVQTLKIALFCCLACHCTRFR
jgi:hypothetical protein